MHMSVCMCIGICIGMNLGDPPAVARLFSQGDWNHRRVGRGANEHDELLEVWCGKTVVLVWLNNKHVAEQLEFWGILKK